MSSPAASGAAPLLKWYVGGTEADGEIGDMYVHARDEEAAWDEAIESAAGTGFRVETVEPADPLSLIEWRRRRIAEQAGCTACGAPSAGSVIRHRSDCSAHGINMRAEVGS
jgi:hypothetical protein